MAKGVGKWNKESRYNLKSSLVRKKIRNLRLNCTITKHQKKKKILIAWMKIRISLYNANPYIIIRWQVIECISVSFPKPRISTHALTLSLAIFTFGMCSVTSNRKPS